MQHLDEGTIHAWLDGALAPDESRRVEAHAASCDTCSARVAEARGLIAASSRILTALDEVPAGVIPVREGESAMVPDDLAAMRARKAVAELSRRRRWWRQPRVMAAAGIVFVAAGTFAVMQQGSPRFAPALASDQATEAAPPQAVTAPAPSLGASAVDRLDSSRTTAPTLARPSAAAPTEGRLAKEEAASREKTEAPQEQRRDLAATPSRSPTQRTDRAEAMKQTVQGQAGGAQSIAQVPAAPSPQQQTPPVAQLSASANRLSQVTVPPSRPVPADSVVGALQRARERDTPAEPLSDRANAEKALWVKLFAGCYQIRPLAGARSSSLVPEVIMLDTVVAVTRGDTAWYRAQTLDAGQSGGVDLSWRRVSQITESAARLVEISVRREQATAVVVVAVERFADIALSEVTVTGAGATAAKATDARATTPRPPTPTNSATPSVSAATHAARQTSCPRR